MRKKIERTTCDGCEETYEHATETFGGIPANYFTLFLPDAKTRLVSEKHFCKFQCLWNWVQKMRRAADDSPD